MKKRNVFFTIIALAAIMSLAVFGCTNPGSGEGGGDDGPVITINTHPASPTVVFGEITGTLTVSATVTQGTLSYQWYSNTSASNSGGTMLSSTGATTATFTIPTNLAIGEHYFFCEVRATGATSRRSNVATVKVDEYDPNRELPKAEGKVPYDLRGATITDMYVYEEVDFGIENEPFGAPAAEGAAYWFNGTYLAEFRLDKLIDIHTYDSFAFDIATDTFPRLDGLDGVMLHIIGLRPDWEWDPDELIPDEIVFDASDVITQNVAQGGAARRWMTVQVPISERNNMIFDHPDGLLYVEDILKNVQDFQLSFATRAAAPAWGASSEDRIYLRGFRLTRLPVLTGAPENNLPVPFTLIPAGIQVGTTVAANAVALDARHRNTRARMPGAGEYGDNAWIFSKAMDNSRQYFLEFPTDGANALTWTFTGAGRDYFVFDLHAGGREILELIENFYVRFRQAEPGWIHTEYDITAHFKELLDDWHGDEPMSIWVPIHTAPTAAGSGGTGERAYNPMPANWATIMAGVKMIVIRPVFPENYPLNEQLPQRIYINKFRYGSQAEYNAR